MPTYTTKFSSFGIDTAYPISGAKLAFSVMLRIEQDRQEPISKPHLIPGIVPDTDWDFIISENNKTLAHFGFPPISEADVAKMKMFANAEWTDEVRAAYEAVRDEERAAAKAAEEEAAKQREADAEVTRQAERARKQEIADAVAAALAEHANKR